jgi:hypothetical protein
MRHGTKRQLLQTSLDACELSFAPACAAKRHCKQALQAATGAVLNSTANPLDGIVPYNNHKSSKLKGRSLPSNPLQGLWEAAAKTALRAELTLAALVDRHVFAPFIMAGLAGLLVGAVSVLLWPLATDI